MTHENNLRAALEEVRDLIEGYVDVKDGASGPLPNNAMLAMQVIDEALRKPPVIGTHKGHSILAWVDDPKRGGRHYYDRIAMEEDDGSVPLAQMRSDEFVTFPGLIYRKGRPITVAPGIDKVIVP